MKTLTNITVHLVIALAEPRKRQIQRRSARAKGVRCPKGASSVKGWPKQQLKELLKALSWKKTIETLQTVGGYSEHFRHEGIGISRGQFSFYRPSGGRLERTECSVCAEKSCASEGPYRSKAQGAKRLTTLDMLWSLSEDFLKLKEAEFRECSCGLLQFSGWTACSNGFYKRKLPRE